MRFTTKLFQQSKFIVENAADKCPLPPLPGVSDLVRLYRVRASKQLSQNFLYDPSIINRFVDCLSKNLQGHYACEVGPGPGSLTRGILQKGVEHLTVVEKDSRFLPMLQYIADVVDGRLSVVHGDILKFDISNSFPAEFAKEWHEDSPPFCVFGNLPFNISLPLLFQWLDLISRKDGVFKLGRVPFALTFQCEVAERLTACPSHPQRSRLSVTAQYLCDIEHRFTIGGGAFVPKPKVEVGVVKITPKRKFDIDLPFTSVDRVVKHLLSGHKKKPSKFGIRSLFPPARTELVDEVFRVSGVSPESRPVTLEVKHFRDLCYAYEDIAARIPQLKLVDTFDSKEWAKRHFDKEGNPVDCAESTDATADIRKQLNNILHSTEMETADNFPRTLSRQNRKKLKKIYTEQQFKNNDDTDITFEDLRDK